MISHNICFCRIFDIFSTDIFLQTDRPTDRPSRVGMEAPSPELKKDQHPSIRNEWGRLHAVVREEKAKAENAGCTISLDPKKREVLKDGTVIDQWRMSFL